MCTEWFTYFDVYFQMHVMSKCRLRIFKFLHMNALSLVYIGYESGGNDLKTIGDVATFT